MNHNLKASLFVAGMKKFKFESWWGLGNFPFLRSYTSQIMDVSVDCKNVGWGWFKVQGEVDNPKIIYVRGVSMNLNMFDFYMFHYSNLYEM